MKDKKKSEKPRKGYWYLFWLDECVLCGIHEEGKIRQYTPKPIDPADRYEYSENACPGHFM